MDEGIGYPQKTYLNFVGAGVSLSVNDPNGSIDVTIPGATGGHVIQDEGTPLTARTALNFIGVGVTATDDAANNRTTVTITGAGQTPWTQDIWAANFNLGGVKGIGVGAGANPVIAAVYVQTAGAGVAGFRHFDSATTGAGSIIIGNDLGHLGGLIFGGSALATVGLRDVLSFYTQSATPIIFATQEVERMRVKEDGKVGIACTPFSEQLEVRGDVRFKGPTSSTFLFIDTTGAAGSTAIYFQAAGAARGNITAGSTSVALSSNTYLSLQTGSTPAERVRITAAGLVGIGKTPATYKLEVSGDIDITGVYRVNGVPLTSGQPQTPWAQDIHGNSKILYSVAAIGIQVASPQVALQVAGQIWSVADTVILEYAAHSSGYGRVGCMSFHPLTLWTDQLERMRITAAGDVGIGIAAPGAKLHVMKGTDDSDAILVSGASTTQFMAFQSNAAAGRILHWNGSGFGNIHLCPSGGNVGIGTTNVTSGRFTVEAATDRVLIIRGDPVSFGFPPGLLGPILEGVTSAQSAFAPITLTATTINLMPFGGSGVVAGVGIGTTAPGHALDIVGNCNVTGQYLVNGVPLSTGGSQTPWATDIDGNQKNLLNPRIISINASSVNEHFLMVSGATVTATATFINSIGAGAGNSMRLRLGPHNGFVSNPQLCPYVESFSDASGYGGLAFGTYRDAPIERMSITPDGGVGVAMRCAAGVTLDIAGYLMRMTVPGVDFRFNCNATCAVGTATAHPLQFYTGNVQAMLISATQTVGIGPDTPSSKLTLSGGPMEIRGGNAIMLRPPDNSYHWEISSIAAGLQLRSGGGPIGMTINASGQVGIGQMSAPYQTLSIIAPGTITGFAAAGLQVRIGESSNNGAYGMGLGFCYINAVWSGVIQNVGPAPGPMFINPLGGNVAIGNIGAMLPTQPTWVNPPNLLTIVPTANPTNFTKAQQQVLICEGSANPGYGMAMGYSSYAGGFYGGSIQAWHAAGVGTLYLNPSGGNIVMGNSAPGGADTANMPLGTMMIYYNHTNSYLYFYIKRTDTQVIRQAAFLCS